MTDSTQSPAPQKLAFVLLSLRVSIALVFFVWALDKLLAPEHTQKVFSHFYGLEVSIPLAVLLGGLQLLFVLAFLCGFAKKITYLLVMLMHAGSTLASMAKYFDPLNNLLFFTAWPMLAACVALYVLRDFDRLTLPIGKRTS
ncbi:hypothetical protein [Photobacterium sp. 1_MG-2023]|uniref:hypothetical protein n=1 Tax=Photobacterium sp. 1_MG-2023 TaxID=3062646 RepID=UPI0026E39554|nr:hypothetical protein [Photobacterium sp. 1_MG-2023]MDO6706921.1 hypothetical protein [Photobacterium sp. 1_MG-2023]